MNKNQIEVLLPEVMRRTVLPNTPMDALLESMAGMLSPAEKAIGDLPEKLAVYRTPKEYVFMLAYFVDLDRYLTGNKYSDDTNHIGSFDGGIDQLRTLIAAMPMLARWRGTSFGLTRFLEIATGVDGFVVSEASKTPAAGKSSVANLVDQETVKSNQRDFHIYIDAPEAAKNYRALVLAIIEQEKPAYVTYSLRYAIGIDE